MPFNGTLEHTITFLNTPPIRTTTCEMLSAFGNYHSTRYFFSPSLLRRYLFVNGNVHGLFASRARILFMNIFHFAHLFSLIIICLPRLFILIYFFSLTHWYVSVCVYVRAVYSLCASLAHHAPICAVRIPIHISCTFMNGFWRCWSELLFQLSFVIYL